MQWKKIGNKKDYSHLQSLMYEMKMLLQSQKDTGDRKEL